MSANVGVLYVPCDGAPELRTIPDSLPVLQELVGGYVETIGGPDWTAWLNEDGKGLKLPANHRADQLARLLYYGENAQDVIVGPITDMLVGPVLFTGPPDNAGDLTDVRERALAVARDIGVLT